MTDHELTGDGDNVPTLQQLIRARMDERGWNYADLAARSDERLSRGRWQQLGTGRKMAKFPEPDTLAAMADALEIDVATVLLAAGQTLGLPIRRRAPELAHLLPAGTDRLDEQMRDAVLAIIRAAVAATLRRGSDDETSTFEDVTLDWSDGVGSSARRNAALRSTESRA